MRRPLRPVRRSVWTGLAVGLGMVAAATGLAACGGSGGQAATFSQTGGPSETNANYPGALVFPKPYPKTTVTLTDTEGQPYDIATQTRGTVTLVYFGYTHCPDLCPLNMYLTSAAIKAMPAADRRKVKVVFVTTDPDRDTPSVIRTWLNQFDPSFVGLTGPISAIHTAESTIGMPLSTVTGPTAPGASYLIVHAGYVLVYTQDNRAHMEFPAQITPAQETKDLMSLVEHGWQG